MHARIDPQQIMNLINSVTSGININFSNNGYYNNYNINNNSSFNNINFNNNNNDDDDDDDDDEYEEIENNNNDDNDNDNDNENNDEIELFMKKRNQYILELDEFQFKHLKKYTALKEDKCPICLVKYKGIDIIKEFPCKHIFHKNCIFKWLKTSNMCPLCKYDITNDVNNVILKTEEDE